MLGDAWRLLDEMKYAEDKAVSSQNDFFGNIDKTLLDACASRFNQVRNASTLA